MSLDSIVKEAIAELDDLEKRQDELVHGSRDVIRDCAKAIKSFHTGKIAEFEASLAPVEEKVKHLRSLDKGLERVTAQCYQEFVELKALHAAISKKEYPSRKELDVPLESYLSGLADCIGELRREVQISLMRGDKAAAQAYYEKMSDLYEHLMLIKHSSSLVGSLRRKLDVSRGQLEQVRSELLRAL